MSDALIGTLASAGLAEAAEQALAAIAALEDPGARYAAATAAWKELAPVTAELERLRATGMAELHEGEHATFEEIAERFGLSRGRVGQLVAAGRRALNGAGGQRAARR